MTAGDTMHWTTYHIIKDVTCITTGLALIKIDNNYYCFVIYMAIFIEYLIYLLPFQVEVQTNLIFVVKSLYFQKDRLTRKTINHLTQDFGKKEIWYAS